MAEKKPVEGEEGYIPPGASGPRKKDRKEREVISSRMYGYWNDFYRKDTESKIARVLVDNLNDPESLFYDEEFLQRYVDEIEAEKGVKNSRWKVEK